MTKFRSVKERLTQSLAASLDRLSDARYTVSQIEQEYKKKRADAKHVVTELEKECHGIRLELHAMEDKKRA